MATPPPPTTTTNNNVVRVGVGVLVQDPENPNKIFCGIRKGSHGSGTLALPGGHLELYESWEQCAIREVFEEMNIQLDESTLQFVHVTNDPMPTECKHYVTIFIMGKCSSTKKTTNISTSSTSTSLPSYQRPQTMEPEKCEGWYSYSWKELQDKLNDSLLFGPLQRLVHASPSKVIEFLS